MRLHELLDKYSGFTKQKKIAFLSSLACELTVEARDTYVAGTTHVADPERLRAFNELQHRVASHLQNVVAGDRERYPDDVICGIIFEGLSELKAESALRRTLGQSENRIRRRRKAVSSH